MPSLTREEVLLAIPHRPPFLYIDSVVEVTSDRIHARVKLEPEMDVFRGHYPHFPVFPGVLQCEACFQAGAILISRFHPTEADRVPVVVRLNNVKFRQLLRPGDELDIHVQITDTLKNTYYLSGTVNLGEKLVTQLDFAVTSAPMSAIA